MKLTKKSLSLLSLLLFYLLVPQLFAQEKPKDENEKEPTLYDLSMEELMNVSIISASQKEESLFDAPVSSYSITREEIVKSGVTSIPEALRLCPGVVVRETTNGNYDIHIRGFDNLARYTATNNQVNTITLVMIDNRPIFNYNGGGTAWETLPIDIVDIERIEVVRGPNASLYGPNAVSGVINIITKRQRSKEIAVSANALFGTPVTAIANVSVGKAFNDVVDFTVTANYQKRKRDDEVYLQYYENSLRSSAQVYAGNKDIDPELALEKYGVNTYLNLNINNKIDFQISGGIQNADAQKVYMLFSQPLTSTTAKSSYMNIKGNVYGVGAKISLTNGFDHISKGTYNYTTKYDYTIADVVLDYPITIMENLHIKPSINFQKAKYSDLPYVDEAVFKVGLINAEKEASVISAALKGDYVPLENLRVVSSVRIDKFDVEDKKHVSYQLASTYKLDNTWLFRIANSRSNSGFFIGNAFLNSQYSYEVEGTTITQIIKGDKFMKLPVNQMTEVGVRAKIKDNLQFDVDIFRQRIENLNVLFTNIDQKRRSITYYQHYSNASLVAKQTGASLSVNYVPNQQWQIKPYVTIQRTMVEDAPINPRTETRETVEEKHTATPTVYGGAYVNYVDWQNKLNININGYFLGNQKMYHFQDKLVDSDYGNLKSKFLLNAKVAYKVMEKVSTYFGGRNILGNNSREFYGTDRIGSLYYIGAGYNF